MGDPFDDLKDKEIELALRQVTWQQTDGFSVVIRPEHFDPRVQEAVRAELAKHLREDEPEKYIPIPRNKLKQFNQPKIKAQLEVIFPTIDHFDQRPTGTITINGERFRLVFQSYELMLMDLWQCSQPQWRQWIYKSWNPYFKEISAVVNPDNCNQTYPTSALYFEFDPYGKIHPEVENCFIILTYDEDRWRSINGAVLILNSHVEVFKRLRASDTGCKASL